MWPSPVSFLCLSLPSPSRSSSWGHGTPPLPTKRCGGQDMLSAGQACHTLKGGERSETGETYSALEMESSCGVSGVTDSWRPERLAHLERGNALDSSHCLPNQETWGLPAPGRCPPGEWGDTRLCVLGCPSRLRPALGQQGGAGPAEEERRVASLGGGIPEPAKNSRGNYSNTFPK